MSVFNAKKSILDIALYAYLRTRKGEQTVPQKYLVFFFNVVLTLFTLRPDI